MDNKKVINKIRREYGRWAEFIYKGSTLCITLPLPAGNHQEIDGRPIVAIYEYGSDGLIGNKVFDIAGL